MNYTHREITVDAAKLRREYVRNVWTYRIVIGAIATSVVFYGISAICYTIDRHGTAEAAMKMSVCGCCALVCGWFVRLLRREAREIPYVPPIREQRSTLPAVEILLRGSEQPAVPAGELVRPVVCSEEKPVEELLRPAAVQVLPHGETRKF